MDQINKCFANKHNPHIKEYVSPFGNIATCGYLYAYKLPGANLDHWVEIPFAEYMTSAAPEAIVIIEFIRTHKRLPNFIAAHLSYEHRKLHDQNTRRTSG